MTGLIQKRSSQMVAATAQFVKWISPKCSECVSSDFSTKAPMSGRSSHWLINISGYSYTVNIKEDLKQLKEKVIEKYNSGNGYKKTQVTEHSLELR